MRMKYVNILYVIVLFGSLFIQPIYSTNLRGQINGMNQYTKRMYPLQGVIVELYMQRSNKWKCSGRYITGNNGMYFFNNVVPGNYVVQVNNRSNYPINVKNRHLQDLSPILLQY